MCTFDIIIVLIKIAMRFPSYERDEKGNGRMDLACFAEV